MAIYYFVLLLMVFLVAFLFWLLANTQGAGKEAIASDLNKSRQLIDRGKLNKATRLLLRMLRNNGWDYARFLEIRATDPGRQLRIRDASSNLLKALREFEVIAVAEPGWLPEIFLMLDEVYEKQGDSAKRHRLQMDFRGFIDDDCGDINRGDRADILSRLSLRQAAVELERKDLRTATHMEVESHVYKIERLSAYGDFKGMEKLGPFQPSEALAAAFAAERRQENLGDEINRILEPAIIDKGARIDWPRIRRDLDGLLRGRLTAPDKDREIAVMIYAKVFGKVDTAKTDGDKAEAAKAEKTPEKKPGEEKAAEPGPPSVIKL